MVVLCIIQQGRNGRLPCEEGAKENTGAVARDNWGSTEKDPEAKDPGWFGEALLTSTRNAARARAHTDVACGESADPRPTQ
ncbi:hypothetical protein NDU88_002336 [Pleurodeles waltl]|uniref:Uncharacterized protein n=1 Tax=Pleurodeles waltl TaxID=8319 RepID=A0AAV7VZ19_PLEWA|nr:hypothetical protein NDU88_002336 [Pleurodeles waltl]